MKFKDIYVEDLEESALRDVLKKLFLRLESSIFLRGEWDFVEIEATASVKNYLSHTLNIKPVDVITLKQPVGSAITFNTSDYTNALFVFTPDTAGNYRFLIGKAE